MASSRDEQNLHKYVKRSLEDEEEFHFLRFEYLQRLNITQLEVKLARIKSRVQKEGRVSARECNVVRKTLRDYGMLTSNRLTMLLIGTYSISDSRLQVPKRAAERQSS
jgi:hypothetical protein